MSRPGPAPLPTHLKVLRGTARPDRINKREPKAPSKTPRCPDWLSDEAKVVWKRTVKQLKEMGILSDTDGDLLATYANAVVTYQKATVIVDASGILVKGRRDTVVTNPAVRIQRDTAQLVRQLGAEFGLSPASRTRIQAEKPHDTDIGDILD